MKVIRDSFIEWIDRELAVPLPTMQGGKSINKIFRAKIRKETLQDVRAHLLIIIENEFKKMEYGRDA